MRQITAALQTAQAVRAPRCRVTCTFSTLGTGAEAPAVEWSELVSNAGQSVFNFASIVGLSDGSLLRFERISPTVIQQQTIDDPTVAGNWTSPSATRTILTHDVLGLFALRISTTLRLWYIHAGNGNVFYIESTDDGDNWSSPVTVYSGGDASHDLVAAHIDNGTIQNGPWFFGFSVFSSGVYTARFGYYDGANWVTHAYDTHWRAAGIDAFGAVEANHRVLVFKPQAQGTSRLRQLDKSGATYSNAIDIDETQAGNFGLALSWYRFKQMPDLAFMMGVGGEHAKGSGAYAGYVTLWHAVDQIVDETIILPDLTTPNNTAYFDIAEDSNGNLYLAGDTVVYSGAAQTAPADELVPLRYTYDDHTLQIEFDADGFPAVKVGHCMTVTRTLSWNSDSGSEDLCFYVVRCEQVLDYSSARQKEPAHKVILVAVDPVGFMGLARCRRPMVVNNGAAAGVAELVRKIAGRFGLKVHNDTTTLESAAALSMTIAPNESLLGAAYRASAQANFWLVPKNNATWYVTLIKPPESNSGDYADTAHVYGASGGDLPQPLIGAVEISDYRRLAFSYILGTHSTDPEDGASLGMAQGPVIANTRPISYSLTNTRYNTSTRVSHAAEAEAERQKKLNVDAVITTWPNLALEQYDMVEVTESRLGWSSKSFRVRWIVERWEKNVLTQEVYLGLET